MGYDFLMSPLTLDHPLHSVPEWFSKKINGSEVWYIFLKIKLYDNSSDVPRIILKAHVSWPPKFELSGKGCAKYVNQWNLFNIFYFYRRDPCGDPNCKEDCPCELEEVNQDAQSRGMVIEETLPGSAIMFCQ